MALLNANPFTSPDDCGLTVDDSIIHAHGDGTLSAAVLWRSDDDRYLWEVSLRSPDPFADIVDDEQLELLTADERRFGFFHDQVLDWAEQAGVDAAEVRSFLQLAWWAVLGQEEEDRLA